MEEALKKAYRAGFDASGEGYNGEYPFRDHGQSPEADKDWVAQRDKEVLEILAEQPAQQEHPEQMARLGWQCIECPACGAEGARAFPKPYRPLQDNGSKYFGESWDKAEQPAPMSYSSRVVAYAAASKLRELGYRWLDGEWVQPAQRTWVGLSDEERDSLLNSYITDKGIAKAIEAKLRSKNEDRN